MAERIVDARWLTPPEPFELTLAALGELAPGDHVRLLIHREPVPLFGILDEWGYRHRTRSCDDGTYDILIWHKDQGAPDEATP